MKYIQAWEIGKLTITQSSRRLVAGSFELNRNALDLQQFISSGKY